jgi:hypothetical protein
MAKPKLEVRYIMNGKSVGPLTRHEIIDWQARIEVGDYAVRYDHGDWMLFKKAVVGSDSPHETYAFVGSYTLFREALGEAKARARRQAALAKEK